MKRKFYTSYVYDSWTGEKVFNNSTVLLEVAESDEKLIPVLLQRKLSKEINDRVNGRFFPVTLINFWEIDIL
jgi:hypothetical protein